MSARDQILIRFIDFRIEACLRRPGMWGTQESVEGQVLQLLDVRNVALNPTADFVELRRCQMDNYARFLHDLFPDSPPEPLYVLLRRAHREAEFSAVLKAFVGEQRHRRSAHRARRPLIFSGFGSAAGVTQ